MKQIGSDAIGQLMDLGKQAVKQTAAVPGQITGIKKIQSNPSQTENSLSSQNSGAILAGVENNAPSQSGTPNPMIQLIRNDNQKRQSGIDNVRRQLAGLKIKRYRELQQQIQIVQKNKEEEIPEYIAGKPGAPRTREEQFEQQERQAKMAEKQDDKVELPSGPGQGSGSMFFAKQRKGSGELKLGKQG